MAQDCYHRSLTPVEGNGQEGLPMESHTEYIRQQLYDYTLVVVQAPPGTGKTLVVPETAWCWAEQAVLLTEPTRFAAQKLVESFQKCRSWWRGSIQLVTGEDKDDEFFQSRTRLVIATHGMLWAWITSGHYRRIAQRFSVVIIDEYAKVPVGRGGNERLQPTVEEMAWVVWKQARLIGPPSDSRDAWRQRLVLASAKIDPACVRDFFNVQKLGFVNVFARQYTLSRYVVAPMDTGGFLKVCAELAAAALRRGDGNVIVFLPGFREIMEVERMVDESRLEIEYACENLHSEVMGQMKRSKGIFRKWRTVFCCWRRPLRHGR
ncbi:DEAD/DEAH box helicase [bacterium]|nr:DEAD/DEAH box helicase [bacterium]